MFARRAVKILHSFTALFSESWQAISRRREPRTRTDVADQRGLSAAIRRIRENPWFLLLQSCVCRFGGANLAAHARRVRNARYIANATHAWRLICFIACFSLILSTQPTVPAGMGKSAEKPNAHLTRGLPGLNLPNLNEARRMSPAVPKISPPVSATPASKVGPPAPAPPPVQDDNLPVAMLAPMNRVGTGGEDLLSRNYNWGLPLVGLPGRAGLDLNLTLSLNSLIWTKSGGNIHFDNEGFPSPGFHLGFPELKTYFYNSEAGTGSRLVVMPSGQRCEFWENTALEDGSAYIYEERNGSNMIIVEVPGLFDPSETVWTLLMPDGTAYKYVVVGDDPKCVQMEDRNGNYISVAYNTSTEKITKVTDTVGREVNFNYDGANRLTSITQNWAGGTHTWATFAYSTVTISAGFLSLNMVGAQNGQTIPVLSRVGLADGSVYSFDYNTYGQVYTIHRYSPKTATPSSFPGDYTQLSYVTYDLPRDGSGQQNDCPRFYTRTGWANNWNNNNVVNTTFDGDLGSWGSVTTPDGVTYKEFYGAGGTWQRGLTVRSESWYNGARKKYSTFSWTNDDLTVTYPLRPKLVETDVHDDADNRRRTTTSYTSFSLPSDVYEYGADAATVLRRTHIDYNLSAVYTNRRIIGLPSARYVYDGNGYIYTGGTYNNPDEILVSKVTYVHDLNPNPNPYLQHQGPPVQHDTANYGPGFVQGRGNLNVIRRWDVTDQNEINKSVASTIGYNTSGSVIFRRDPLNHRTSITYTDSFSDSIAHNTLAYPTLVEDADQKPSKVQYNYDFGAVTRTEDPKGAAVVNTYDSIGRVERIKNEVNQAYTRYVYAPDHLSAQSYTTINDLSSEFYQITVFDGHGRTLSVALDHPGSEGGYKAQSYEYDIMGRMVRQTNPTEVNGDWEPAGDDAGWVWSSQAYDWNSRPTVSTNQDGTTREISYNGCGCAGGGVMTSTDEGTVIMVDGQLQTKRRQQKVFHDILGREVKTQALNWEGGTPYSTTVTTYNARDQITSVKEYSGDATGAEACPSSACKKTEMTYDGHGRLWKQRRPIETADNVYLYNPDDTLWRETDPRGITCVHSYNNRGLVTEISYDALPNAVLPPNLPSRPIPSSSVTFGYDEAGNRIWMDDAPGRVDYTYDQLSRLKVETRLFDVGGFTRSFTLRYEYNLAGQLKQITDPWNATVTYNRNKAGQEISVTGVGYKNRNQYTNIDVNTFANDIRYRAWGGIKQFTNGSLSGNNAFAMDYDARLRLTRYTGNSRTTEHDYYNDGLIKEVRDLYYGSDFLRKYEYDHVGQLTKARAGGEAQTSVSPYSLTYGYDAWGHLTLRQGSQWGQALPDLSTTYVNDRNTNMAYDEAGDVKGYSGGVADPYLHYNAAGQLFTELVYGSDPQYPAVRENYYDGNGAKVIYIPFNGNLNDGTYSQSSITYLIRSSVLERKVIAEFRDLMLPWLPEGDPLRYYSKSYVYLKGVQLAFQEFAHQATEKWVTWIHHNPVIGNLFWENQLIVDSSGQLSNIESNRALFDPLGGILSPIAGISPVMPNFLSNFSAFLYNDQFFFFARGQRCFTDGISDDCGKVASLLNSGNAVIAPWDNTRSVWNPKTKQYELALFTVDWDNGFYGFLPTGARYNGNGTWSWVGPQKGRPTLKPKGTANAGGNDKADGKFQPVEWYTGTIEDGAYNYVAKYYIEPFYDPCAKEHKGQPLPGKEQATLALAASFGNADFATRISAIWAKESWLKLRPDGDAGPAQLTTWWSTFHPELIVGNAYGSWNGRTTKLFDGDVRDNIATLRNIVYFSYNEYHGSFDKTAYWYGPGHKDPALAPRERRRYANETVPHYNTLTPFFDCLVGHKEFLDRIKQVP